MRTGVSHGQRVWITNLIREHLCSLNQAGHVFVEESVLLLDSLQLVQKLGYLAALKLSVMLGQLGECADHALNRLHVDIDHMRCA